MMDIAQTTPMFDPVAAVHLHKAKDNQQETARAIAKTEAVDTQAAKQEREKEDYAREARRRASERGGVDIRV